MNALKARLANRKNDEGGFTLIELLIVIVILGILSAVVVFSVGGIQNKGDKAACKAELNTIRTAQEAYYASQPSSAVYAASNQALVNAKFLNNADTTYFEATDAAESATVKGHVKVLASATLPSGCTL